MFVSTLCGSPHQFFLVYVVSCSRDGRTMMAVSSNHVFTSTNVGTSWSRVYMRAPDHDYWDENNLEYSWVSGTYVLFSLADLISVCSHSICSCLLVRLFDVHCRGTRRSGVQVRDCHWYMCDCELICEPALLLSCHLHNLCFALLHRSLHLHQPATCQTVRYHRMP